ncbi:MAG: hypothetical protein B7Z58_16895 [Acidiphilium sp. 37-64-53]|uniref:hypothetical protein n=1 Tax=Acidiphilium sp. 37-64-53 TaxID=1970299 RepID=UPI000BDAE308|nr:hypothetical protein [Acidiphilium sp. 37-64-53]OYW00035.1 MAG: hypothetical protein B7Z58_16895 [Acidiphilium sp. 37-64-53]HQT89933.1 hypothetical protein [Acidiphilium sp.]
MNQISSQPPIQTDDQNFARSVTRTTASDQAAALRESFLVIEDGAILLDARLRVMLSRSPRQFGSVIMARRRVVVIPLQN